MEANSRVKVVCQGMAWRSRDRGGMNEGVRRVEVEGGVYCEEKSD